jgi:outer membrane protein assembly factor BamB
VFGILRALACASTAAAVAVATVVPSAASAGRGIDSAWVGAWSAPGPPLASVLAADDLGTVAAGHGGDVRAFDPRGAELWSREVGGRDVGNQPALLPGLVVVASSDRISALDRATGASRWERPASRSRIAAGTSRAGREVVLAATRRGELFLLDATDGSTLVDAAIPGAAPSSAPYVWLNDAMGVVAWSTRRSCCRIGGLDLDRGVLTWQVAITSRSSVPVVHRGKVVVATGRRRVARARVTAYDVRTGDVTWRTRVHGSFETSLWGDAEGDDVVVADAEGSVLALDVGDGTVRWVSEPVEASEEAHPKIAGNRVFLTPLGAGLVEIDRASGRVVQSAPFRADVFVHSSDGARDRFAVLVGDGLRSAVWTFAPPPASGSGPGPPLH